MEIQCASQTDLSIPSLPRLAYSIAEAEALSGLSRSTLYRMMEAGTLKTVQRGRRRLVPADELTRLCSLDKNPVGVKA